MAPNTQKHNFGSHTGTRIKLTELEKSVNKTDEYLRPRIARRFSIIGPEQKFQVFINGKVITKEDRGFYKDIQFLWHFDSKSESEVRTMSPNIAVLKNGKHCEARLSSQVKSGKSPLIISGYIATVDRPAKLVSVDANINQLSIFANGRVFQEDVLRELGNSKVFNSYLIGEIHANFLDADETDRATASSERGPKLWTGKLMILYQLVRSQHETYCPSYLHS